MAFDVWTDPNKSNPFDLGSTRRKSSVRTVNLGNGRCMICGKKKDQVGRLEKAHVLAKSKGGKVTVLLCPKHHVEYDSGKLTGSQLAKIGVSSSKYGRYRPKISRRKPSKSNNPFDINVNTRILKW